MIVRLHVFALAVALSAGCATNHSVKFNTPEPDRAMVAAEIERCLVELHMGDVSAEWPYSEYIEEFPDDVVAIWQTPPIEYESGFHRAFQIPEPADYGTAWVRPDGPSLQVTFHDHDHALPERFRECVSEADIDVEVESYKTLDLS